MRPKLLMFAFSLILCTIMIGMAELVLGSWLSKNKIIAQKFNLLRDYTAYFDVSNLYPRTPSQIRYHRDKNGLRGTYNPESKNLKIITVGGSTTDCRYTDDSATWPEILKEKLQKKFQKSIEMGNAGLDGHSSYGHLSALEEWLPALKPDVILFYVGINDYAKGPYVNPYDVAYSTQQTGFRNKLMQEIRNNSFVFDSLKRIKMTLLAREQVNFKGPPAHSRNHFEYLTDEEILSADNSILQTDLKPLLEIYRSQLQKIVIKTKEIHAKPILMTQPAIFGPFKNRDSDYSKLKIEYLGKTISGLQAYKILNAYNNILLEVCASEKIFCVDVARDFPRNEVNFYDFVHNTEIGSAILGQLISDNIPASALF